MPWGRGRGPTISSSISSIILLHWRRRLYVQPGRHRRECAVSRGGTGATGAQGALSLTLAHAHSLIPGVSSTLSSPLLLQVDVPCLSILPIYRTSYLPPFPRQVDVALRFVDWYADKGDAYEYNAAALERHMNALAVGNRPRAAQTVLAVSGAPLLAPPLHANQRALAGSSGNASAPPLLHVPWDASAATRAAYQALPHPFADTAPHWQQPGSTGTGSAPPEAGGAPLTGSAGVRIGGTVEAMG
jgi:hypothetical protein